MFTSFTCQLDLSFFSLYIFISQRRSCDNTLKNCTFQILSYFVPWKWFMKRQRGEFPWDPHWQNKMTSTRLWSPAVLAKIRVWVGCSFSRSLKTCLGHSYWGIFEKKRPFGSSKKNLTFKARLSAKRLLIRQLHDDVILLQLPESLSLLFSSAN